MTVTVVVGPPCAGKSTFVQDSAIPGDLIVDYDLIARALGASEHRPQGAIRDAAFAARSVVIDQIIGGVDADSWVIHTNPSPAQVDRYKSVDARFVLIDPGIDVCEERAATDERPEGTVDSIRKWYASPPDLEAVMEPPKGDFFGAHGRERNMETKMFMVKASEDADTQVKSFTGYASTWTTTPDSYGDIVEKGAFADTLLALKDSGKSLPVLWSHEYHNPASFVAKVVDIEEDDHGLWVRGVFFDDPESLKVYRLIKERVVSEMSFAFDVVDSEQVTVDGEHVRKLKKLNLFEVSIVMFGANSDTSIESVKEGQRFTATEVAALKELVASRSASEEEEVAGKPDSGDAALRVKERINALIGAEMEDSK
jgi:HK97 family phage prohead protease